MLPRLERFIQERKYLKNVSPRTIEWYEQSLAWLRWSSPQPKTFVNSWCECREAGLKPSSCNCHIRGINGYPHWSAKGLDQKCHPACSHLRVVELKEEDYVPATFTVAYNNQP